MYINAYMWNLKSGTDELVCREEIETQVENKLMDTKCGKPWGGRGGMSWEIGIGLHTRICIKYITKNNLLYKKIKLNFKILKNKI